jgi:hypothetical protein
MINAAAISSLASGPRPPSKVEVLTSQLVNDTGLRWQKNPEKDLAGYFVRYRSTSSPVWENSLFTTDTTMTVKLSKDDYLFGVQAVDNDGNSSLVALPRPTGRQ